MTRRIALLGATGSIGEQTLDVVSRHPQDYAIFALTAHRSVERMRIHCLQYQPVFAVMTDPQAANALTQALRAAGSPTTVLSGDEGLITVATHPEVDMVVAGIVGMVGFMSTLEAAYAGKTILLANKESLVVAGHLLMPAIQKHGAVLLPVDSEHNGVFQCLGPDYVIGTTPPQVSHITLTASGGPFLRYTPEQLQHVTPEMACRHPRWNMGPKISVDSATMMNKGLEIIEAHWLFQLPAEQIHVVIHPQSIVHAMVTYTDGGMMAHLGMPDMRVPIAQALAWPHHIPIPVPPVDWSQVGTLQFEPSKRNNKFNRSAKSHVGKSM
ncbi:1-deoxy-D-xylulose-5-phosphate reductoisomerase [bacterium]|nr:1-deoxy-D-xylulose-5-phosphate reductoisomerase [bacterium]